MFQLRYIINELRRRRGRTIVTSFGLALGVALVIGIVGFSQGLDNAQGKTLSPLKSIGTDILVTRVAGDDTTSSSTSDSTTSTTQANAQGQGRGGGGFFAGGAGGPGGDANALNSADAAAVASENSNVLTDLSKLGAAGTKFTHDFFLSASLLSFPDAAVSTVQSVKGVSSVTSGLTQLVQHETGTVPQITANVQTGGDTLTAESKPAPLTAAEQDAVRTCLQSSGAITAPPSGGGGDTGNPPTDGGGGGGRGRFGGANNGAFEKCLPQRFQDYQAKVVTPLRTISQVVNPPQTDINNTSYTVAGIDPKNSSTGLVTKTQLVNGRWINSGQDNEILVATSYASKQNIQLNGTVTINGENFTVVGLVNPSLSGNTADIYFTLAKLQSLSTKQNRVTQLLVKVKDPSQVSSVAANIKTALPGAEVVTQKDLAGQITGSLTNTKKLADRLDSILGIVVLAGAFAIAALLTLSSVAKRVREIGTLRAIGWSKRRVTSQILGETIGIGIIGAIIGVALGFLMILGVNAFSPKFSATSTGVAGLDGSTFSRIFGQSSSVVKTTTDNITLHAHMTIETILLGVAIAILGSLIAGAAGGWRAARAVPADALRTLG